MLKEKFIKRYDRNISVPEIGILGQEKICGAKVLVCGAGGLGSAVLLNLAALGVGKIGIVDCDTVELSNLNRQFIHSENSVGDAKVDSAKERILAFNPDIWVETYNVRLSKDNYADIVQGYDVIADCFDSFSSKFLLNYISVSMLKPLVHGGVSGFFGQVMTIVPKENSACLECLLGKNDTPEYVPKGVVSPAVSTIASIQSMEVLKLILAGDKENIESSCPINDKTFGLLKNRVLIFDGLNMKFKVLEVSKKPKCVCSRKDGEKGRGKVAL